MSRTAHSHRYHKSPIGKKLSKKKLRAVCKHFMQQQKYDLLPPQKNQYTGT